MTGKQPCYDFRFFPVKFTEFRFSLGIYVSLYEGFSFVYSP